MKRIKLIISIVLSLLATCICVSANSFLGDALYTDVVTYINHYPIPSCNYKGNTLIAVEDLTNYGFDISWNEYTNIVTLTRNKEKNKISQLITFKPVKKQIGKKYIAITTTETKVVAGNYNFTTFGGVAGKTLIDVSDLSCIDKTSVVWVPEVKAVKVWIEDGLEIRYEPFNVRELNNDTTYYESCMGFDPWGQWQWQSNPEIIVITFAETISENSNINTNCFGIIRVLDVIDANGKSRLKNKFLYEYDWCSLIPYAYGFSDSYLSHMIIVTNNDLYPNTAEDHGGLIKVSYECNGGTWTETIRVDCLPYQLI